MGFFKLFEFENYSSGTVSIDFIGNSINVFQMD